MSLHDYVRLFRRGWWVVLLGAVFGVAAAVALTLATPATYYSTASLYVSVPGDGTPTDLQNGNSFATERAATYASLVTTTAVLDRVVVARGGADDVATLRESVTATARAETSFVDITAGGTDPAVVAERANAVATALGAEAARLDASGPVPAVRLAVVQPAEVPETATEPRPRNNLMIGLAVGLVLGLAAVVVADALSTTIRSSADLPRGVGLATLTSMPTGPKKRSRHLSETDARLEAFRQLRANLQFGSHVGGTIAVAGVTGASDGHAVARQLAAAFGEIGSYVVVLDLDFRVPDGGARARRGSPAEPTSSALGVADVLNGAAELDDVVTLAIGDRVHEVPAGHVDSSSAQRLSTPAMRQVLDSLGARFDHVILACPPLVERSESAVAAALAGSALVVVESGQTKRSEFQFALELLAGVRVTSISVAVDHVRDLDLGGGMSNRPGTSGDPDLESRA
ncbi:Wzz/FepE/Etk N-terminal domain-containing protein [Modestobacter sp. VKM Ac-2986]|uniref:Wzz/FepE/Etk N-terminal domain-containing protein n=1 Tax=Modestobacter sp. VKM Ac-2986 TaxID=3004140 RepID=UPI0022ABBD04|nr:Wzz/FepE/Etk N-terminal domain-containing protein [Modestobacter sp. VKM Ac-2986]MCZ2830864.1 Wzz/FepE/Etk N-terminal domain-containing protein [Modestobacter sp. VKM Ac-2986]